MLIANLHEGGGPRDPSLTLLSPGSMGTVGQVAGQGLWKVHPTPDPAPQHRAFGSPWGPLEASESLLCPGLSALSGLSSSTALQP